MSEDTDIYEITITMDNGIDDIEEFVFKIPAVKTDDVQDFVNDMVQNEYRWPVSDKLPE